MDTRTNILYLITSTNIGGTEKALHELLRRIDRGRYRVHVCSLKRPGGYAERLAAAADGFSSLGLGEPGGLTAAVNFIPALVKLIMLLRRVRPQIVHCFLFRANIMGRLAAACCPGVRVISSVRVLERSSAKYALERLTRRLVSRYTAVTEALRQIMIARAHVAPEAVVRIYNGIEPPLPAAGAALPSRQPGSAVRVALIGRLERQKGHAVLLAAVQKIVAAGGRLHVYFAGEGPDGERIRELAGTRGVAAAVSFAGVVDDVPAFLAGMDIVVLPSLWEGMPNVLLEAMAAGRPVVASRLPGIDELVQDGQSGLLCEPGNALQLAEAITRLMNDQVLAARLAAAARRDVRERFGIQETVFATCALYEQLLREPAATGEFG